MNEYERFMAGRLLDEFGVVVRRFILAYPQTGEMMEVRMEADFLSGRLEFAVPNGLAGKPLITLVSGRKTVGEIRSILRKEGFPV